MSLIRFSLQHLLVVLAIFALTKVESLRGAAPPNDLLINATELTGALPIIQAGTMVGATMEPDEPNAWLDNRSSSVWYKWKAPISGRFAYSLRGDYFAFELTVFDGNPNTDGDEIASGFRSSFMAIAETEYYIQVLRWGYYGNWAGRDFELVMRNPIPPANDNFASAEVISGNFPLTIEGNNEDASKEEGEIGEKSVWYRWVPTRSRIVVISATTNHDDGYTHPVPDLYLSQGGGMSSLIEAPETNHERNGYFTAQVTAGQLYFIRIREGWFLGGHFALSLSDAPPPPANDAFSSAILITGNSITGTLNGATHEPQEASDTGTVWYRWTAPTSGLVGMSLFAEAATVASLQLFRGASLPQLAEIMSEPASRFPVDAGAEYFIRVSGYGQRPSAGKFSISLGYPPVNDLPEAAITLSGALPILVTGATNLGAGIDETEPSSVTLNYQTTRTVWWKWTAPDQAQYTVSGSVIPNSAGQMTETVISVYSEAPSATSSADVQCINSPATFTSIADKTYYFSIDSQNNPGTVTLVLALAPENDAFANAIPISDETLTAVSGNLTGSSEETDETQNGFPQSVWYRFSTTTATGPFSVSLTPSGSAEDVQRYHLSVWQGASMNRLHLERSSTVGLVNFQPTPGVEYRIRVSAHLFNSTEAKFRLTLAPSPSNDLISSADPLPNEGDATVHGWNLGATHDSINASLPSSRFKHLGPNSVWWTITPTTTDLLSLNTFGSTFDTVLRLWKTNENGSLSLVRECDNASKDTTSRAAFVPEADQQYLIEVVGRNALDEGEITLNLSRTATPTTANELKLWARAALESRTPAELDQAKTHLEAAFALAPTDSEVQFLLALVRLARLQHQPEFDTLMTEWGFQTVRGGLTQPRYEPAYDASGQPIAAAGATTAQALAYANVTLLPELALAETNLAQVAARGLNITLSDAETGCRMMLVDLADIQVLRASGKLVESAIRLSNTWDTDVPWDTIFKVKKGTRYNAEKLLALTPKLLTKRLGEERAQLKSAYQTANSLYKSAHQALAARNTSPNDGRHMFFIPESRDRREAEWASSADSAALALDGPTVWDGATIDLRPLLNSSAGPRSLLPRLMSTKAAPLSAPDATFGGVWAGNTLPGLDLLIKDNRLLYDTSSFLAFMQVFAGRTPSEDDLNPNGDSDQDGLSNFAEYVFALNPQETNIESEFQAQGLQPSPSDGQDHFTLSFVRLKSRSDLSYTVYLSDDLKTWDSTGSQLEQVGNPSENDDHVSETVTFRVKTPANGSGKYVKIVVSQSANQ